MLHALEFTYQLTKLSTVIPGIAGCIFPSAERKACHLSSYTYPTFVQDADCIFVPLAFFTEQLVSGDLNVVEIDNTSAARPNPQFLFFFGNREALCVLIDDESRDTFVALARI